MTQDPRGLTSSSTGDLAFGDGSSVLVPASSDYESTDAALVADAAARLTQMAGSYRSAMIGNAGFFKLDYDLSPRQFITFG